MINSTHKAVQFEGVSNLRRLISVGDNAPIQKVVDSSIVPKLLEIMTCEDDLELQNESSWCILNICAGENKFAEFILELGGLDILINLLDSENNDLVLHAIGSIRNIAGAGGKCREMCIEKDCMGKPCPEWQEVLFALPGLYQIISNRYSEIAVREALWIIAHIICADENIQEVIDQGFVPLFVDCLSETNPEIVAPVLRALGILLTGTDDQTDTVLSCEKLLPRIFELTTSEHMIFRKEVFWSISNIAAGTEDQIEMLLEKEHYMERLKTAVATEREDIAKEAAWAICNMITKGTSNQISRMMDKHGLLESFTQMLTKFDNNLKKEALEAILAVMKTGHSSKKDYHKDIREVGLIEIIRDLAKEADLEEHANFILQEFKEKSSK